MVAVAVRTSAHVEAALPVLQAKKSLFIDVKTLVGFQTRQAAYVKKVKEILDSGALGRILSTSLVASFCFPAVRGRTGYAFTSHLYDAPNGNTMLDIDGGHLIDVLHYLFGPISSVVGHLATQYPTIQLVDASGNPTGDPIPQSDVHQVVFGGQFANKDGTVLSVNIRNIQNEGGGGLFWVTDGEKGTIKITAERMNGHTFMRAQPELWLDGEKVDVVTDTESGRAGRYWDAFAEGKEGEYATIEDALRAKEMIDAI
ncbi:transcription regulator gal80 [Paramarasmius palmivorus]|uniref:Transcription regulator gal80 n=1 Tax=Paramarasmius palmivorus TaxID=297713 RepID=A0AAW0C6R5_9AGAR